MRRLAVRVLIIILSLAIGVLLGYQIKNNSIYNHTAVTSSHGIDYKQNTYIIINREMNSKIDSLFGHNTHKEIIIQVVPDYRGYSVESRILSGSVLAKQVARDRLNNWISKRMSELHFKSNYE